MRTVLEATGPAFAHGSQKLLHLRAQALVIVLQGKRVFGLPLKDLRGDRLLIVQRAHRHDTAFDVQPPQDFRNCRDLVRAVGDFDLPQRQQRGSRQSEHIRNHPLRGFGVLEILRVRLFEKLLFA